MKIKIFKEVKRSDGLFKTLGSLCKPFAKALQFVIKFTNVSCICIMNVCATNVNMYKVYAKCGELGHSKHLRTFVAALLLSRLTRFLRKENPQKTSVA